MAIKINFKKYDEITMLCRNCNYARIYRNVGFVCNITKQKPDYHLFCPYFVYYYSFRAKKELQKYKNKVLDSYFRYIFGLLVLFLISTKYFYLFYSLLFAFVGLIGFIYFYKILNKPEIRNYGYFFYIFSIVSDYILIHKKSCGELENDIVKQQFIRIYSHDIYVQNFFKLNKSDYLGEIEKKQIKLKYEEKTSIFEMVSEVYFYKNITENFDLKLLKNLAINLNINEIDYYNIISKVIKKEKDYNIKKQQKENYYDYIKNSFQKVNYYEVLGLLKTATNEELQKKYKELAKKYHPDVIDKNSENENIFKEITEAYYYLKKERNF